MGIRVLDICFAGLTLWLFRRLARTRSKQFPPGPLEWPVIGNLLDFPIEAPYKTFRTMSQKYGPIFSLNVMGKRYVILNSLQATADLLEKKSAITSNRPHFTMGCDLVGWSNLTIFLQNGDKYKKHRKLHHKQLGTKSSLEKFYPAEEEEARRYVGKVLKSPENLIAHSRRMAGTVMMKISHGYSFQEEANPLVEMADKAMHTFSVVTAPGGFLVDQFPILRYLPEWFPGAGFQRLAKQWRKTVTGTADALHAFVLERLSKGDAALSITSRLLQEGVTPEDEEILKWASFAMYVGGSETTPSVLSGFFLAMTLFPEVFKKAQAEVDNVIGHDRLPTVKDRDSLPYVNALCKELLRWHVVVPLAMHETTQDVVYDGYLIPKGTCLLGNIWHILSDPERYPDPDTFDPERFLGENQQMDPLRACFGWGRRSCPGMLLSGLSIFIAVATALAALDISRCVENGVQRKPKYDVQEGTIRHVKPFECKIVARSTKANDLLCT